MPPDPRAPLWRRIIRFYGDGFRSMTVGRQLWLLIAVKVIILFAILKVFFFPDIVRDRGAGDEAAFVRAEILSRNP